MFGNCIDTLVGCTGEPFGGVALCACSLKLCSLLLFVYVEGIDYESLTTVVGIFVGELWGLGCAVSGQR